MLFKLSYLNSNFALTPDYLNPALNNPAQGFISVCLVRTPKEFLTSVDFCPLSIIPVTRTPKYFPYLPSSVGTRPSRRASGSLIPAEIFTCSKQPCLCFLTRVVALAMLTSESNFSLRFDFQIESAA